MANEEIVNNYKVFLIKEYDVTDEKTKKKRKFRVPQYRNKNNVWFKIKDYNNLFDGVVTHKGYAVMSDVVFAKHKDEKPYTNPETGVTTQQKCLKLMSGTPMDDIKGIVDEYITSLNVIVTDDEIDEIIE